MKELIEFLKENGVVSVRNLEGLEQEDVIFQVPKELRIVNLD